MHNGNFSLCCMDFMGNLVVDIPAARRQGRRLCFSGAVTCFGHYTGYNADGSPIIDCAWLDAKGDRVTKNGKFHELKSDGTPRHIYITESARKKALKPTSLSVNKTELQAIAVDEGVPIRHIPPPGLNEGKLLSVAELKDAIKAKRSASTAVAGGAASSSSSMAAGDSDVEDEAQTEKDRKEAPGKRSLKQLVGKDWEQYESELEDMAATADKFFVADSHDGDYHILHTVPYSSD